MVTPILPFLDNPIVDFSSGKSSSIKGQSICKISSRFIAFIIKGSGKIIFMTHSPPGLMGKRPF